MRLPYLAMTLLLWACTATTGDSSVDDSSALETDDVPVESVGDAPEVVFTMSPPGGTFSQNVLVRLEFAGAEPDIYYTLDGTMPNDRDEPYEGPITIAETTTLRAVAVNADGDAIGNALVASYVRLDPALDDFTSNLPLVVLTSDEALPSERRSEHTPFAMQVYEPGEDGRATLVGDADLDVRMGLKVRGSSSSSFPKKPYGVEIWSAEDDLDHSVEILGMPAESDWVLLSPLVFDRALMRNALIYELSRDIGRYAPRTRFVEVFSADRSRDLDEDDYLGVYVLMERIKRDPERVAIAGLGEDDLVEPELSGGYMWKEDRLAEGESGFTAGTAGGAFTFQQRFVLVDPKEEEVRAQQESYLEDLLDDFGDTLNQGDSVEGFIDADAFVDHHILNTYAKNPDAFRLSGYFHKDREGLIHAGPIWDFDRTMGCAQDWRASEPTWWDPTNLTTDTTDFFAHGWWLGLFRDPGFTALWVERWRSVLANELSVDTVNAKVDRMAEELSEAAPRNFARWSDYPPRDGGDFAYEVELLKDWLTARHGWISACIEGDDPLACTG